MNFDAMLDVIKNKEELLSMIYVDTLQPGAKQVGIALDNILGLGNTVLLPIRYLNGIAQQNFESAMREYQMKLENVNEDDINQVPPEIGVDILDRIKIVQNQSIRDLYVNILVSASQKDSYPDVHPKVVKTIELFTPDEAIIIEKLYKSKIYILKMMFKEIIEPARKTDNIGLSLQEKSKKVELNHIFSSIDSNLNYRANKTIYYENLIEWGVIRFESSEPSEAHEAIKSESIDEIEEIANGLIKNDSHNVSLNTYEVSLTEFGKRLISVCFNE